MSKDFNPSYIGKRNDLLNLIPVNSKNILDIGCSTGTLGKQIKEKFDIKVTGIELSKEMAKVALSNLDEVIIGDVEKNVMDKLGENKFDCIILGDIIEHLRDPWHFIKECHRILEKKGAIIASIPNIRHLSTIYSLVIKGYWPYRERGIHDKTHLRFFTLKTIEKMIGYADCKIIQIKRNYRIIDKPHRINKIAKYLALPYVKDFLTYQFLLVCKKKERN